MLFFVRISVVIPIVGRVADGSIVGVVEAESRQALVEEIDLLDYDSWDDWRVIPGVPVDLWEEFGPKYLYPRFFVEMIRSDPSAFGDLNHSIRMVFLEEADRIDGGDVDRMLRMTF